MSDTKLRCCPFCGGEAKTYPSIHIKDGVRMRVWYAVCNGCKINYPQTYDALATTEEEAIKRWNTRKPIDRIVEQLEEQMNDAKNLWDDDEYYTGQANAYEYAIDIVKVGVKND